MSLGIFHPFCFPCVYVEPWTSLGSAGRTDIWNHVFSRLEAIKCIVRSPSRRSLQFYSRDNESDDTRCVHNRGCGCENKSSSPFNSSPLSLFLSSSLSRAQFYERRVKQPAIFGSATTLTMILLILSNFSFSSLASWNARQALSK